MELKHALTGHRQKIGNGSPLPTDHCGMLTISITKARIYDYSGLFRLPVRIPQNHRTTLRPSAIAAEQNPNLRECSDQITQINDIGDSYDPHPFRPGDVARHIHWKLTHKTGKLILNGPVNEGHRLLLRLHLHGTEAELDKKMGTLLWLGELLAAHDIPFEIACFSALGYEQWSIENAESLMHAVDTILSRERSTIRAVWQQAAPAFLQYDIGADSNEA